MCSAPSLRRLLAESQPRGRKRRHYGGNHNTTDRSFRHAATMGRPRHAGAPGIELYCILCDVPADRETTTGTSPRACCNLAGRRLMLIHRSCAILLLAFGARAEETKNPA